MAVGSATTAPNNPTTPAAPSGPGQTSGQANGATEGEPQDPQDEVQLSPAGLELATHVDTVQRGFSALDPDGDNRFHLTDLQMALEDPEAMRQRLLEAGVPPEQVDQRLAELQAAALYFQEHPEHWDSLEGDDQNNVVSRGDTAEAWEEWGGRHVADARHEGDGVGSTAEAMGVIFDYFPMVDHANREGGFDGSFSEEDLEAILEDPDAPPELQAAARYLLEHNAVEQLFYAHGGYNYETSKLHQSDLMVLAHMGPLADRMVEGWGVEVGVGGILVWTPSGEPVSQAEYQEMLKHTEGDLPYQEVFRNAIEASRARVTGAQARLQQATAPLQALDAYWQEFRALYWDFLTPEEQAAAEAYYQEERARLLPAAEQATAEFLAQANDPYFQEVLRQMPPEQQVAFLETLAGPLSSTQAGADYVNQILDQVGQPGSGNFYARLITDLNATLPQCDETRNRMEEAVFGMAERSLMAAVLEGDQAGVLAATQRLNGVGGELFGEQWSEGPGKYYDAMAEALLNPDPVAAEAAYRQALEGLKELYSQNSSDPMALPMGSAIRKFGLAPAFALNLWVAGNRDWGENLLQDASLITELGDDGLKAFARMSQSLSTVAPRIAAISVYPMRVLSVAEKLVPWAAAAISVLDLVFDPKDPLKWAQAALAIGGIFVPVLGWAAMGLALGTFLWDVMQPSERDTTMHNFFSAARDENFATPEHGERYPFFHWLGGLSPQELQGMQQVAQELGIPAAELARALFYDAENRGVLSQGFPGGTVLDLYKYVYAQFQNMGGHAA